MRKTCGIFVDIEDAAQESKDQTCIATGTKNNGCFDRAPAKSPRTVHSSTRTGRKTDAVEDFFECLLI